MKLYVAISLLASLAYAGEKPAVIVPPRCFRYVVLTDCRDDVIVPNYVDRGGVPAIENRVDHQANNFTKFRPLPDQMSCKARVKFNCTELARAYRDVMTSLPVPFSDEEPDIDKLDVNRRGLQWMVVAAASVPVWIERLPCEMRSPETGSN